MKAYINGMSCISPCQSWDDLPLTDLTSVASGNRLRCIEPDYLTLIDPKSIRRMSRIIKMGVSSGIMALRRAGLAVPDGIITGTGYGCQEDTVSFLSKITELKEEALNPTPFIQSTHNTIGGQIALLLQCQGYNQTYAQGSFSFESALLDAMLLTDEDPTLSLLVGGIDESVDSSHHLLERMGVLRPNKNNRSEDGIANGEGAAFFVVSGTPGSTAMAAIVGLNTHYKPSGEDLTTLLRSFLRDHHVDTNAIDLVLQGSSGMHEADSIIDAVTAEVVPEASTARFKHLCGEYPVATAFATWLAARSIYEGVIPNAIVEKDNNRPVNTVLLLNHYFGDHYTFMLLKDVE